MDIISLIIGNACSLFAMGSDSISSTRKTVNGMLWAQNASQLFYAVGSILLKGYSAAVQNAVCVLRNLAVIKGIKSKVVEWVLVILGVVIGLISNNLGIVGLLPIIANLQYTLAVFKFKDNERALKISFLITCILFIFFSLKIWNFVGVITNSVVAITTTITLIKTKGSSGEKTEEI